MSGWYEKCPVCGGDLVTNGELEGDYPIEEDPTISLICSSAGCDKEYTLYYVPHTLAELDTGDEEDCKYREWSEHSISK